MKNVTDILISATAALSLIGGISHANETPEEVKSSPILKIVKADNFIAIPLDTRLTVKNTQPLDLENPAEYTTDYTSKIRYDLLGNVDADFGIIKTQNVKSRYRVKSGALPRGRYFRPINSKLGAGLSRKF